MTNVIKSYFTYLLVSYTQNHHIFLPKKEVVNNLEKLSKENIILSSSRLENGYSFTLKEKISQFNRVTINCYLDTLSDRIELTIKAKPPVLFKIGFILFLLAVVLICAPLLLVENYDLAYLFPVLALGMFLIAYTSSFLIFKKQLTLFMKEFDRIFNVEAHRIMASSRSQSL